MSFLVVANFKSNKTEQEVKTWLKAVKPTQNMVVAPSFPHLPLFTDSRIHGSTDIQICSQDVSPFPPGSYTGAVSAVELKELGVDYCIVGHSERRRYFHETSVDVANKVAQLLAVGITPLICMEAGDITPQFSALDPNLSDKCYFCFEPSGDIGGTVAAKDSEILAAKKQIESFSPGARVIYGGSVNSGNAAGLLKLGLAGFLISTASLDPSHYQEIVGIVNHAS